MEKVYGLLGTKQITNVCESFRSHFNYTESLLKREGKMLSFRGPTSLIL